MDLKEGPHPTHRLASLDGWRALSIVLVLGAHCRFVAGHPAAFESFLFRFIFDGDLGVRCFFLISGFLITWLMLVENDVNGRVSLRHFYIRRALRILPVYFAYLGVLFCLQCLTPFKQSRTVWLSNLTFTTNFVQGSWTSGHLWSLSVEEQFYIGWPALFVLCGMPSRPKVALTALSIPVLVAPVWRIVSYKALYPAGLSFAFAHFSFFNYFDCLAFGCICAFLLKHERNLLERLLVRNPWASATVGCLLLLAPKFLGFTNLPGRLAVGSTFTLQSIGFAIFMTQSVLVPKGVFYPALNWKPVRHVGVLSYSIYIWQQLFCTDPALFGLTLPPWWMSFPGWLLSVLLMAHFSYFALERPLFRLRSYFR